jgi:hypothetical protein
MVFFALEEDKNKTPQEFVEKFSFFNSPFTLVILKNWFRSAFD